MGVVLHHRGHGSGHGAEMDRDVLGLRDHATALVEKRRRAVAPLLDVRGEGRADEDGPHLLGDRAQEAADDLHLDVHAGSQSVRVEATAYDQAETSRGLTR